MQFFNYYVSLTIFLHSCIQCTVAESKFNGSFGSPSNKINKRKNTLIWQTSYKTFEKIIIFTFQYVISQEWTNNQYLFWGVHNFENNSHSHLYTSSRSGSPPKMDRLRYTGTCQVVCHCSYPAAPQRLHSPREQPAGHMLISVPGSMCGLSRAGHVSSTISVIASRVSIFAFFRHVIKFSSYYSMKKIPF